jgi:hypothetical protein
LFGEQSLKLFANFHIDTHAANVTKIFDGRHFGTQSLPHAALKKVMNEWVTRKGFH